MIAVRKDFRSPEGSRFGSRVVTAVMPARQLHGPRWIAWRCDCGQTGETTAPSFRKTGYCKKCSGKDQSVRATKHGGTGTRLYVCWRGMLDRASGRHGKASRKWYLDKGITVCPEWQSSFEAFSVWALANGYHDDMTLDRIRSCFGYSPENCEWVSREENVRRAKQDIWRRYETTPIEMLWGAV